MAYETLGTAFLSFLVVISLWEAAWKAVAMWKSARNGQLAWFVLFAVFNTAGILPIVYLLFFQKKRQIIVDKKSRKK